MSAGVNKVILVGNLGADPELRQAGNSQVCDLRLATNESWKDKDGVVQEKVEWHRVSVWGKQGENCAKYLKKGRQVYIEGRLETRSWEDEKTHEKKYATNIVANTVQFLGGKDGGGEEVGKGGGRRQNDEDIPY